MSLCRWLGASMGVISQAWWSHLLRTVIWRKGRHSLLWEDNSHRSWPSVWGMDVSPSTSSSWFAEGATDLPAAFPPLPLHCPSSLKFIHWMIKCYFWINQIIANFPLNKYRAVSNILHVSIKFIQLILEQRELELHWSTYVQIFFCFCHSWDTPHFLVFSLFNVKTLHKDEDLSDDPLPLHE